MSKLPYLSATSKEIFLYIVKHQPVSKADICLALHKRPTSMTRMMEPLEQAGLVKEAGIGMSSGGRKPVLYGVSLRRYCLAAVNISTLYCEVALIQLDMSPISIVRFDMQPSEAPEAVINRIVSILREMLDAPAAGKRALLGCGVSLFNSLNPETQRIYRSIKLYTHEGWFSIPIGEAFETRLQVPVAVEKGTNAAAMLEYGFGQCKGGHRMLYILCAMNIRSAVVSNGELQNVDPFYEDAFGHMVVKFDGESCSCGRRGCVDSYTTIPAIVRRYLEAKKLPEIDLQSGKSRALFSEICAAAERGEPTAITVIREAAEILGLALSNYINLFCPDLVVLSGLLIQNSKLYYDTAVETATQNCVFMSRDKLTIVRNGSFSHAITVGAATVALNRLFSAAEPL